MIHRSTKFADKYKNMVKKNTTRTSKEVAVTADDDSKLSNTPKPRHDSEKAETETLPNRTAVLVDDVVKPESSQLILNNIDGLPSSKSNLDVDRPSDIVKDVDSIQVDSISNTEIDMTGMLLFYELQVIFYRTVISSILNFMKTINTIQ